MKLAIIARNRNILPTPDWHTWAPGVDMANEAKVLNKLGVDVRVYCAKGSMVEGQIVDFGMLPATEVYQDIDLAQRAIREVFYNNVYQLKVIAHLKKHPVDIIHLHDYRDFPLYNQADLNIPIVVTLHGDFLENFEKTPEYIKPDINNMNIMAIGQSSELPKGIKAPITVIPNMLDLERFEFIDKPKERVVYAGRMILSKGPDLAIQVANLAGVKIGLYGELLGGEEWETTLKELIVGNQNATYFGHLPYSQVAEAFNASALLLPMRQPEGFGNVVLEAMACGTPVITFGLGGTRGLIRDGINGFLVEPGNIKAMAKAIKQVREIDRARCREYVLKEFNQDLIGQKLIKVFKSVINDFKI